MLGRASGLAELCGVLCCDEVYVYGKASEELDALALVLRLLLGM